MWQVNQSHWPTSTVITVLVTIIGVVYYTGVGMSWKCMVFIPDFIRINKTAVLIYLHYEIHVSYNCVIYIHYIDVIYIHDITQYDNHNR